MRLAQIWFHCINRNYKKRKEGERRELCGSILRHGEAWLEIGKLKLHWSWNFWSRFCGWELKTCGEESDLSFFTALPPVAIWFSIGGLIPRARMEDDARYVQTEKDMGRPDHAWRAYHEWRKRQPGERETGISIHDWKVWFEFWQPTMEWKSRTPWYRNFAFGPIDFLLGDHKYSEKPLYEEDVEIPMPEKTYSGTVKIYESSWKRPRWPWTKRIVRSTISVEKGIPHPGKGENSWDCGEDATYGLTSCAKTPQEAIVAMIESVMRDRKRYGHVGWKPQESKV